MSAPATQVRERPIIMTGESVRAILAGRKTQTRRVVKFTAANGPGGGTPTEHYTSRAAIDRFEGEFGATFYGPKGGDVFVRCPYGQPGDRLWVREAWAASFYWPMPSGGRQRQWNNVPAANRLPGEDTFVAFRATGTVHGCEGTHVDPVACDEADREDGTPWRWQSSRFMPRWASRLTLELTGVRVERLNAITANDCIAEGIASRGIERDGPCIASALMYIEDYKDLWDSLNAKRGFGWDVNPWVWVLEFRRAEPAVRA